MSTTDTGFAGITADDGTTEDALEHHQRLALRLDTDAVGVELSAHVLDDHRRDRAKLVVAKCGQQVRAPHLEVATLSRRLQIWDGISRPPLLADELGERHPRLDHARRKRAELLSAPDVGLERDGVATTGE